MLNYAPTGATIIKGQKVESGNPCHLTKIVEDTEAGKRDGKGCVWWAPICPPPLQQRTTAADCTYLDKHMPVIITKKIQFNYRMAFLADPGREVLLAKLQTIFLQYFKQLNRSCWVPGSSVDPELLNCHSVNMTPAPAVEIHSPSAITGPMFTPTYVFE